MTLKSTIDFREPAESVLDGEQRKLVAVSGFMNEAESGFARAAKCLGMETRGCVPRVHGTKKWRCKIPRAELALWGARQDESGRGSDTCDLHNADEADVVLVIAFAGTDDDAHDDRVTRVIAHACTPAGWSICARKILVQMAQTDEHAMVRMSLTAEDLVHMDNLDKRAIALAYVLGNLRRTDGAPLRIMLVAPATDAAGHTCSVLLIKTLKFLGYSATSDLPRGITMPKHEIFGCCSFAEGADMGCAEAAQECGVPCFGTAHMSSVGRRAAFEKYMMRAALCQKMGMMDDTGSLASQDVCDGRNLYAANIVVPILFRIEDEQRFMEANVRAVHVIQSIYDPNPDHELHCESSDERTNQGVGFTSRNFITPDIDHDDIERFANDERAACQVATFIRTCPVECSMGVPTIMFVGPGESAMPGITDACRRFFRRVFEQLGYAPVVQHA